MPFPDEGGDGNDVIFVDNRPAYKDLLTCGDGLDGVLVARRKDEVAEDCERVAIGQAEAQEVFGPLEEAGLFEEFEAGLPPFLEGYRPLPTLEGTRGTGAALRPDPSGPLFTGVRGRGLLGNSYARS